MDPAEHFPAQQRDLLLELSLLISEQRGVDEIYAAFASHVRHGVTFDFTSLFVVTPDPQYVRAVAHYPEVGAGARPGSLLRTEEMGVDLVARLPQGTEYIPRKLNLPSTRALAEAGYQRAWATPLIDGQQNYGMLTVAKLAHGAFPDDHVAFLRAAARLLAKAVRQDIELERARITAARASAAGDLIFAIQEGEAFEGIFARLPSLLEGALEVDYLGLIIDSGEGFAIGAETPAGVHAGEPPNAEGDALIHRLAEGRDFLQFKPGDGSAARLQQAGYERVAMSFLRDGEVLRGVLMLGRFSARRFNDDERMFIELLRSILSQSLANRYRLDRTEAAAARARTLNEVALLLNAGEGVDAIFQKLLELLDTAVELDYVGLMVGTGRRYEMRMVGSRPVIIREAGELVSLETLGMQRMIERGEKTVQLPIEQIPESPTTLALQDRGYRRVAALTITHGGETLGFLTLARRNEAVFTREEVDFLETLCTMLGQTITNRRKVEEKEAEAIRSQVLSELTVLLQGGNRIEDHFDRLAELALQAVGFDFISITTRSVEGTGYQVVRSHELTGPEGEPLQFDPESLQAVAANGRVTAYRTNPGGREVPAALHRLGFLRAATAIIQSSEGDEGLLTIGRRDDTRFSESELSFIELMAALIGQASANYQKAYQRQAESLRSRLLSELAVLLNNGEPIERHFTSLRELLLERVGFDFCSVSVRGAFGGFRVMRSEPLPNDDGTHEEPPPASGMERILSERGPSVQYGEEAVAYGAPAGLFRLGIKRAASFVLTAGEGPEGLLSVGRRHDTLFTSEEMAFFELVATLLGQAAANERRLARTTAEAHEQAIVAAAAAAVAREMETLDIVRALREAVGRFIPQPFVNFGYVDGPDQVSFPVKDGTWRRVRMGPRFQQALNEGQASVPRPAESTNEFTDETIRVGLQEHSVTRATSGGAVVGLLVIGSRDPAFVVGEAELRLSRLIADIVGPAMSNARAMQRERLEAEEQRVIAEVAAVAAREAEPGRLVAAIHRPLRALVPKPYIAFGYKDGDEVLYPMPNGDTFRFRMDDYLRRAEQLGQVFQNELPDDLPAEGPLRQAGVCAISVTAVQSGGATVGFLMVGSMDPAYRFHRRETHTFRLLAQIVGPAMENARAADRARQEAQDQRILAEAAAAIAGAADEAALVRGLRAPIQMFVPGSRVMLIYDEGDSVRVFGSKERSTRGPTISRCLAGEQLSGNVLDEDVLAFPREALLAVGVSEYAITPVVSGGEVLGVLFVGSKTEGYRFSQRDFRLMSLIAGFTGPAMANLREAARREREAQEQRILAEAAAAVASARNERQLMTSLREPIRMFVPNGSVSLYYLDGEEMILLGTGKRYQLGPVRRKALGGQLVTPTRNPQMLDDARRRMEKVGLRWLAATPIVSGGEALGLFEVGTREEETFSADDLRLLRVIAGFVGPAMANLRESARRAQEAEEQRILAEAAAGIAAGQSETDILNRLVGPVRQLIPGALVAFSYVEGDEMWLWDGRNRRPVHGNSRLALEQGQAVGHFDTTVTSPQSREIISRAGVRHWVDTAATSAGAPVGLLFVGTRAEHATFEPNVLRLLRLIADMTGPAMLNARENARRATEAEHERILAEVAALAARATSSDEILEGLDSALEPAVPEAFVVYGFYGEDSLTYQITRPDLRDFLKADQVTLPLSRVGIEARANGQAMGIVGGNEAVRQYATLGLQAYVLTTYASAGAPLGALLVASRNPDFRFDERTLVLLKRVAQVVGPAVESQRAEAERARQAQLYGLILRSLSEGVVLSDVSGRVVFANEQGQAILRRIDPAGRSNSYQDLVRLLPEENRAGYLAVYEEGTASRGRMRLGEGTNEMWLEYELVPLNDPVLKVLHVGTDVTADVRREEESQRNREQMEQSQRLAALGELISGVAHELNNPLTAILGFAEVMSLSPAAAALNEEISVVQKEALRARNIVRDLLFIARPGTSERASIPVSELVAHIERLRRTAWMQQGIRWEINIEQPCVAWGNEHQLTQVILNLVSNAEHALAEAPEKRITVRAFTRGEVTEISVSDSGCGMDEATRGRVFEPFFTTKQGHGTGLGLPLSYSIVQSHQGEIRVDSTPGVGTTFSITLPAVAPETAEPDGGDTQAEPTGAVRVLVVDDEPSLRKVCQRLIASLGHECVTAENSSSALDLAAGGDFDLVLCDYRLATETADDVLAGFERVAPHLISKTVIATGATTDAGVIDLTRRYNLQLIAKPYGVEELTAVIEKAS